MNERDRIDRMLTAWTDESWSPPAPAYLADVLARTRHTPQRRAWASLERWLPMDLTLRRPMLAMPFRLLAIVLALLLLLIAALSVPLLVGSPSMPAMLATGWHNGLIAVERSDEHINIYDPDAERLETFLGPCCLVGPDWSPDGTKLAFWSRSAGAQETAWKLIIQVATFDQPLETSLTMADGDAPVVRWSPDNQHLAVITTVAGEPALSLVSAKDGTVRPWDVGAAVTDATWRPDGAAILLRLATPDAANLSLLTLADGTLDPPIASSDLTSEFYATDHGQSDLYGPTFSPDGSLIAYTQGVLVGPGHASRDFPYSRSFVMASDGTSVRSVDASEGLDDVDGVTWSPDGSRLSVHLREGADDRVEVITVDGSALPVISEPEANPGGAVGHLWSPDGTSILTIRTDGRSALIDTATGVSIATPWLTGPSGWRPTSAADWQPVAPS